jgi:hypothetical protein
MATKIASYRRYSDATQVWWTPHARSIASLDTSGSNHATAFVHNTYELCEWSQDLTQLPVYVTVIFVLDHFFVMT